MKTVNVGNEEVRAIKTMTVGELMEVLRFIPSDTPLLADCDRELYAVRGHNRLLVEDVGDQLCGVLYITP